MPPPRFLRSCPIVDSSRRWHPRWPPGCWSLTNTASHVSHALPFGSAICKPPHTLIRGFSCRPLASCWFEPPVAAAPAGRRATSAMLLRRKRLVKHLMHFFFHVCMCSCISNAAAAIRAAPAPNHACQCQLGPAMRGVRCPRRGTTTMPCLSSLRASSAAYGVRT